MSSERLASATIPAYYGSCMCRSQHLRTRIDCGKGWEIRELRILWWYALLAWLEYPRGGISLSLESFGSTTTTPFLGSLMANSLKANTNLSPRIISYDEISPSTTLVFRLFCMMEWSFAFIFLVALQALFRKRANGRLDFRFLLPKIRRTLHLMARLCSMIAWNWANIPQWGGNAWAGTVKRFIFLSWSCHKWLSKGAGWSQGSSKTFHTWDWYSIDIPLVQKFHRSEVTTFTLIRVRGFFLFCSFSSDWIKSF